MWNTAAEVTKDALDDVDIVKLVATLAVCYAVFQLVRHVVTAPVIPAVWVPLQPGKLLDLFECDARLSTEPACIVFGSHSYAKLFSRLTVDMHTHDMWFWRGIPSSC